MRPASSDHQFADQPPLPASAHVKRGPTLLRWRVRFLAILVSIAMMIMWLLGGPLSCSSNHVADPRRQGTAIRPTTLPIFVFPSEDDADLRQLRKEFQLDVVTAGANDDLDRVERLCHWVHGQWEHDPSNVASRSDPITILREARSGKRFNCREYAIALAGACDSVGLPARTVGLMEQDIQSLGAGDGHVVTEVYLPDCSRWVMADAQWDVIPTDGSKPLDVVGFEDLLGHVPDEIQVSAFQQGESYWKRRSYLNWINPYLYYVQVVLDAHLPPRGSTMVLVPPGSRVPRAVDRDEVAGETLYTSVPTDLYPTRLPK